MAENKHKVRLRSSVTGARVTFDVIPDLIENRNVNYKTLEPVHMPGQFQVYSGTSSRTFQISNVKLVSRTQEEASTNMIRLHRLRGWGMPYFGASSTISNTQAANRKTNSNSAFEFFDAEDQEETLGTELLGAPPEVLWLDAYSDNSSARGRGNKQTHIHKVPVVLQQLSIPYPSDVDYIPTLDNIPFPTIMSLDLTLLEAQSAADFERFSLQSFRKGTLRGF